MANDGDRARHKADASGGAAGGEPRPRRGVPPTINDPTAPRPAEAGEGPPDTVAVALDYNPGTDAAPRVVAAGQGYVAEQILSIAFAHGVKVRQDADLVQLLAAIDLDSDIPPEAFAAVAEILAYVYKANGQWSDWLDGEAR